MHCSFGRQILVAVLLAAGLVALSGCDEPPTRAPGSAEEAGEGSAKHYSSFGVRLRSGSEFELISFKDVGLGRTSPEPTDPILESIAQSLAFELKLEESLNVRPHVIYDESLADPSEHTYCEGERIYVDLWRSTSPKRWGYSLWSGCTEKTNFARREIPVDSASRDLDEAVAPLTREIADSLVSAAEKGCYRQTC